jgi:acetyl-CoA synthetase
MNLGYRLPAPNPDAADPWDGFEWRLGDEYNIAAVGLASADDDGGRTALRHVTVDGDRHRFTYAELSAAADATAAAFERAGIGPGDRVGVCLPQCPELLVAQLAAFERGAVVVPLSMLLGDDSLSYSLTHSEATALVVDERRHGALDRSLDAEPIVVSPGGYERGPLGGLAAHANLGETAARVATAPDDPALVLYTSGTTGKPKGVVHGHRYLAGSLPGYQAWFELFDEAAARRARVWTPAEWAWAGALFDVVFPTLAVGGTVVSRERRSGFDPDRALSVVEGERVSHAFMPATALKRIRSAAAVDEWDTSSLAVVMSGGEKLPEPVLSWTERRLAPVVHEAYGQTEANALVGNCRAAYPVRPGSMGRAYPGHDVVVVDGVGERVPDGEVGEIAVRLPDPVVFLGYLGDEAATAEKFDGDAFLTGDLAVRDADGYFWHRGRTDDLVLTAGYRVSPLEVEAALESHPDVADAVVGGVPDADRGQRVKAYVEPAAGVDADDALAESLRASVREELGAHKVPREVEFVDAVPETRSGKADRSALFGG